MSERYICTCEITANELFLFALVDAQNAVYIEPFSTLIQPQAQGNSSDIQVHASLL